MHGQLQKDFRHGRVVSEKSRDPLFIWPAGLDEGAGLDELFLGEFTNRIDAKGRVSIPVAFRRVLEAGDPDWSSGKNPNLVVLFGWPGKSCLEVYSIRGMQEVLRPVMAMPQRSAQRETASRMLSSHSQKFPLDEGGRIILPRKLLDIAELDGEATFAGMTDKFEIWNPAAYETDTAEKLAYFEANSDERDPLAGIWGSE